jgi:hypothetical protein
MKRTLLSITALVAIVPSMAVASTNSEIKALKNQMATMSQKIEELESKEETTKKDKIATVKAKASTLEFSGTHYLGFVNTNVDGGDSTNKFETRRNYLQVKGYFGEDSKDYFRITLDTFQNTVSGDLKDAEKWNDENSWEVRVKYAYLYLDNILPYTGIEIGQTHRPWIDYEEHGGWNYRSISKVLVEDDDAAHLTNSADLGFNLQTKTEYFSSELGVFNGEGYHGKEDGEGMSSEWRLTGHILGTGKEKRKNDVTYADVSFFGQMNAKSAKHKNEDLNWYGVHAVYNQPEFLIAAQYVATNDAHADFAGEGYSVNGEFRFAKDWNAIARFDSWELDSGTTKERTIAGITYEYNKYVEFIVNYQGTEITGDPKEDAIMLTAEVNW